MTQENIWLTIWSVLLIQNFFAPDMTLADLIGYAFLITAWGLLIIYYKRKTK